MISQRGAISRSAGTWRVDLPTNLSDDSVAFWCKVVEVMTITIKIGFDFRHYKRRPKWLPVTITDTKLIASHFSVILFVLYLEIPQLYTPKLILAKGLKQKKNIFHEILLA